MSTAGMIFPLRHDIDYRTSVLHIPRVVDVERENGVRSTFFIRTDAIMNLDYLLELQDDGWEFGLHLSSRIKHIAEAQIVYLRSLGFKISGLSTCGSIHLGDTDWHWSNPIKSIENWKMIDSLGLDHISNFGLIPSDIKTPVIETGCFVMDNLYVNRYGRKAYEKLISDLLYYKEKYSFPYYPILLHPDNFYVSIGKHPILYSKYMPRLFKYTIKQGMSRLGVGNCSKVFRMFVKDHRNGIITYNEALSLINNSKMGFNISGSDNLHRPINEENHRGAIKMTESYFDNPTITKNKFRSADLND